MIGFDHRMRRQITHRLGNRGNVLRRASATAAYDVQPPVPGELPQVRGHQFRCFVEPPEGVRQARIGMATDVRRGQFRQFLDIGTHLLGPQGAIDPDNEGVRVGDRMPKGFDRLPGKRSPALIGDGHGHHDRNGQPLFLAVLVDGKKRGLRVERIEDRFHEQQVASALHQAPHLFNVRLPQLFKRHRSKRRIVHVRRHGRRPVGGTHHPGHESRPRGILCHHRIRRLPRHRGPGQVQLVRQVLHLIVGHGDRSGVERIRFDHVRAGFQVFPMERADEFRLGQHQQVVVAFEVAGMRGKPLPAKVRFR